MKLSRMMVALGGLLVLAGCGGASGGIESAGSRPAGPMAGQYGRPQGLIGINARRLVAILGQPRLDIRDRTVHKLQFANGRCVIDAYLYAPSPGREPVTTHIDTRLPTGQDVDIAVCGINIR